MTWQAQHVSRSIDAPPASVIAIAGDPARLPEWAAGLGSGVREIAGRWFVDTPDGPGAEIRYPGPIEAGVLDHEVVLPDGGTTFYNPMRVLPNDDGSEVVFTVYRRTGTTDEQFAADAAAVAADLDTLAVLVET